MSGFVGPANPTNWIGLQGMQLAEARYPQIGAIFAECVSAIAVAPYTSEWWPRSGFEGDQGLDVAILQSVQWGYYNPAAGAASRYGFVGVTRDQYGTEIVSVVVKLYRTSDDVLLDTKTSDATTGEFLLNTPYYPDAHYIVAHKSGAPDVDGVSVNTLIGT